MKKGVRITLIGMVIITMAYFGMDMVEFANGVQKDTQEIEIEQEEKPIVPLTEFKNGRWISTADPLSGIEIKNGKWVMFYKGIEIDPASDSYDFTIRRADVQALGTEHKPFELLTLTNNTDTLEYAILEYSDHFLSLSYTSRGNTLNYTPEEKGIQISVKTERDQPKSDSGSKRITLDTKHCLINKIAVQNGKHYVVADYVDFLTGDRAIEKAKEHQEALYDIDEKGDTLYYVNNDYYVSNINAKLRTLELADQVKIEVWDFPKNNGAFNTVTIKELEEHLASKPIMILKIDNGIIIEMKEQFVP